MNADSVHDNPEVARRLDHLYSLHRKDMDLRLGADTPYGQLLEKLGNPHLKLPPVVHVAGTNGKGSVIAYLRAICDAAGYKSHVYTSPHLLRFNERIRVAGELISDEDLIDLYDRVLKINDGAAVTFFEFTSAMMFLKFAEVPTDIVLLETGMGGRLDCSNVVPNPILTIITKISYDHTQFLGTTLPAIAGEKAGIMKPGVPCIVGEQMDLDAVLPVFEAQAKKLGVPLYVAGRDFPVGVSVTPSLVGAHQVENAATAVAAAYQLNKSGFILDDRAVHAGLTHADWPGRMQHIIDGPVAASLPAGWQLWFDGAHNDSGAMALAAQLKTWKAQDPNRAIHLIAGMSAPKDPDEFFGAVAGTYDTITLVDLVQAQKPQAAADLLSRTHLRDFQPRMAPDISAAVKALPVGPSAIVCVAGSLYLYQTLF